MYKRVITKDGYLYQCERCTTPFHFRYEVEKHQTLRRCPAVNKLAGR